MNTFRYMVDDGRCVPVTGFFKEVPQHHIALIERHAIHQGEIDPATDISAWAITQTGKNFKIVPVAEALHHKLSGRGELVCFYFQETDEYFNVTGYYHVIE